MTLMELLDILKKTLEELNVESQDIDTIIGVVAPLSGHIVSK